MAKRLEFTTEIDARRVVKALVHFRQQLVFPILNGSEIDLVFSKFGMAGEIVCRDQAVLDQLFGRNEQVISGERGKTLVRRIAKSGRPKRQDLPVSLPGLDEKIDEPERLGTEVADAEFARKRGWMQQYAARTQRSHSLSKSRARRRFARRDIGDCTRT